jgi:hypothetical protein
MKLRLVVRRTALSLAAAAVLGLGVSASMPVVFANCGTHNPGGCRQAEQPAEADRPAVLDSSLLNLFLRAIFGV